MRRLPLAHGPVEHDREERDDREDDGAGPVLDVVVVCRQLCLSQGACFRRTDANGNVQQDRQRQRDLHDDLCECPDHLHVSLAPRPEAPRRQLRQGRLE